MRPVVFACAMSLDGYIAGPNGEADWIVMDPDIDFTAIYARFDTFLIGRKTFESMERMGGGGKPPKGIRYIVCSRTLQPAAYPHVTISDNAGRVAAELRSAPGKEIWLFGGGELFRSLLAAGLVDRVEVAVVPVLLGEGIPLLPPPSARVTLELRKQKAYEKSGVVSLDYGVTSARRS